MNYIVQPGDTPMLISHKLSGSSVRLNELVRSNPHKPVRRVGRQVTFANLVVGEPLMIPPRWISSARSGLPRKGHHKKPMKKIGVSGHAYPQPPPNFAVAPRDGAGGGGDDSGHGVEPILVISGRRGSPGAMPVEGTHAGFGKSCCGSCAMGGPCESECVGAQCAVPMPACSAPQAPPSLPGSTSFPVGFGQTPSAPSTLSTVGDALSGWGVPIAIGVISLAAGFGLAFVISNR